MIVDDQNAVNAFLNRVESYDVPGALETMETHISRIFLIDGRAYKLKRAVDLPYVNFSTPERRLEACEKEVLFNSVGAPGLYLGVRKIVRGLDGELSFGEKGKLVDAVVEMVRFEQESLFDRMALDGKLTPELMRSVIDMVVHFHQQVPVATDGGGAANIAGVLDINEGGFATSSVFSKDELKPYHARFRRALEEHRLLLDKRGVAGKIRRCHGDLHLRNICMFQGKPRLFDCIEFNDQIATVDVLYDLAFLLMDLWHRDFKDLANLSANRYLDMSGDDDGFVLLPFFMAVRASVRAHVTATQAEEMGGNDELAAEARVYFNLALSLLKEERPQLVAIGGFSGSGKTTVAEKLAPQIGTPPGARIIESDRIRKSLFGVTPETKLNQDAYSSQASAQVYDLLAERTNLILAGGGFVIADAVFDRVDRREEIVESAKAAGIAAIPFWLDLSPFHLKARVEGRKGGVSDATVAVLEKQLARGDENVAWPKIDASQNPEIVARHIIAQVARTQQR